MERVPMTQAAMRLMLASKKSRPMCTRSRNSPRTISWARSWSRRQDHDVVAVPTDRRLTWSRISSRKKSTEEILSATLSVG